MVWVISRWMFITKRYQKWGNNVPLGFYNSIYLRSEFIWNLTFWFRITMHYNWNWRTNVPLSFDRHIVFCGIPVAYQLSRIQSLTSAYMWHIWLTVCFMNVNLFCFKPFSSSFRMSVKFIHLRLRQFQSWNCCPR